MGGGVGQVAGRAGEEVMGVKRWIMVDDRCILGCQRRCFGGILNRVLWKQLSQVKVIG